ncbi:MAG TPA: DUF1573 domain-containing protein [Verrucomicrobiota bacterium]|nr:DUF1573 domain-containing protein [Verrucomicrobiota bacterium]
MNKSRFVPALALAAVIGFSGIAFAVVAATADLSGDFQPPVHPQNPRAVVKPAPSIPAVPTSPTGQISGEILAWDADQKEGSATAADPNIPFTFNLTNVSPQEVTILNVATSCGCTTARLPPMPWKLAPGASGEINAMMNLAGKFGTTTKTITVHTDKGNKTLLVKGTLPQPSAAPAMGERERNQQLALADAQAIFRGDCARCHVEPGVGKMGKELFAAVCGICHEAEHRATMVPDLHAPKQEMSRELWRVWITYGKPGTLMPAFSSAMGGPLSNEQIDSLIDYMSGYLPTKPPATSGQPSASTQ